jgi:hypothetical protein
MRTRLLVAAAVVLPLFVLYAPALTIPFIGDDYGFLLVCSGTGIDWGRVLREFVAGWGGLPEMGYWRPLTTLSAALDVLFFGPTPFGFHLQNLLIHAANALCVAVLLRRLAPAASWVRAAGAGLFFALHPAASECAIWVNGRTSSQCVFFVLASLIAWLRHRSDGSRWALRLSLALAALGMMSKEFALSLPFLVLAADLLLRWRGSPSRGPGPAGLAARWLGLLALVLLARWLIMGRVAGDAPAFLRMLATPSGIAGAAKNLLKALNLIFLPWNPQALAGGPLWPFPLLVIPALACLFLAGAGRRLLAPGSLVALLLLFAPLAQVLTFPFEPATYGNARLVYPSLAGAAVLLFAPAARSPLFRKLEALALAVLVAVPAAGVRAAVRFWEHAGRASEAVSRAAQSEGTAAPDRWVVLAGVPEWGAWLTVILRPPFTAQPCRRVASLSAGLHQLMPALSWSLYDAGARIRLWDEAAMRLRDAEPVVVDPQQAAEAVRALPPIEQWSEDLVSPSFSVTPFALRAIELDGLVAGAWTLSWSVDPGGTFAPELRVPLHPAWALPGRPLVVPLALHGTWLQRGGAPVTRLKLDGPPGAARPRIGYLARLPELRLAVPPGAIDAHAGVELGVPPGLPRLQLVFLCQAGPLYCTPAPGPDGTVRLTPADLWYFARGVDLYGELEGLLFAEARAEAGEPFSLQACSPALPVRFNRSRTGDRRRRRDPARCSRAR